MEGQDSVTVNQEIENTKLESEVGTSFQTHPWRPIFTSQIPSPKDSTASQNNRIIWGVFHIQTIQLVMKIENTACHKSPSRNRVRETKD